MKKRIKQAIVMLLSLCLFCPMIAVANTGGSGNIDGGGGGMEGGTSSNKWSPGNEGVRVTVVRVKDHAVVTTPIDFSSKPPSDSILNFGKVSKLQYNKGKTLSPKKGGYSCIKPAQVMPRIISTNGSNNIAAIKKYFCSEYIVKRIAEVTGMKYDVLIGGDYKILLEPMAYYKFEGNMFAATATETALYDEATSGLVRRRLVSLSHKNLPLAMFLEVGDLGYPAWGGSKNKEATNAEIKSSLGLGIVRFTDKPEPPELATFDYEYRVDTEVITAVRVSGGQSDPDNPTSVRFEIAGTPYNVGNVYYPNGDSQLAWVRWRTPKEPQTMEIPVTVSGSGSAKGTIHVNIVDLNQNPPPNPVADDRNDKFVSASVPNRPVKEDGNWSIWRPWWQEYWVRHGNSEDGYYWCDHGWWEFDLDQYRARLSATMEITCDDKNPTAKGRTMKSGYGIRQRVIGSTSSNQNSAVTQPQNAVSYFPEFRYETYWRLLEPLGSGKFEFQKNPFSTYKNPTHFSPIWMPDGKYTVNTWLIDSWTPDGMLSANLTDTLIISGNLWQDWHVAPKKVR